MRILREVPASATTVSGHLRCARPERVLKRPQRAITTVGYPEIGVAAGRVNGLASGRLGASGIS